MLDHLSAAVAALPWPWVGRYYASLASTQDVAREAVKLGAPTRSVFVADYQRAGRGRQGRTWQAAPGAGLLMSMIFRQTVAVPRPWRWTSLASVALVEVIAELVPEARPAIKWPNDVLLDGRKVGGILAETTWDGHELVAIVGVGVNVRNSVADLAAIGSPATSLSLSAQREIDRAALLVAFVSRLERWLAASPAALHQAWEGHLWGRGQRLRLIDIGRDEHVVVLGAEPDGTLRVRSADGTEWRTATGEFLF